MSTESMVTQAALEQVVHENGPVVIDFYGEEIAWRPLDYGTWAVFRTAAQAEREAVLEEALRNIRQYLVIRDDRLLTSEGSARDTLEGCEAALRDLWLAINDVLGTPEGDDYSSEGRYLAAALNIPTPAAKWGPKFAHLADEVAAIEAAPAAAQPEREAVAWRWRYKGEGDHPWILGSANPHYPGDSWETQPLYTALTTPAPAQPVRDCSMKGPFLPEAPAVEDGLEPEDVGNILARTAAQPEREAVLEEDWRSKREADLAEMEQEWRWGNLTKLGLANHLRRRGYRQEWCIEQAERIAALNIPTPAAKWGPKFAHLADEVAAIEAAPAAAQPEREAVAWRWRYKGEGDHPWILGSANPHYPGDSWETQPLYTALTTPAPAQPVRGCSMKGPFLPEAPAVEDGLEPEDVGNVHDNPITPQGWMPIETAPKDGRYIVALYRSLDGYAAHLDGRAFVVRHEGKTPSDYDLGWALFPGYGGVPDKCLSAWIPLPPAPGEAA